jgi:hypothetical protein
MPNPYRCKGYDLRISPDVVSENPQMAVKMAHIAACWQQVENVLGFIFVSLLGGEEGPALEIFNMLIDRNLRKEACLALAKTRVPKPMQGRIASLFQDARRLAGARNDVVHGTWAHTAKRAESLMLVSYGPLVAHIHNRVMQTYFSRRHGRIEPPLPKDDELWEVTEYRESDLDDLINRIKILYATAMGLSLAVFREVKGKDELARYGLELPPQLRNRFSIAPALPQTSPEPPSSMPPPELPPDRG